MVNDQHAWCPWPSHRHTSFEVEFMPYICCMPPCSLLTKIEIDGSVNKTFENKYHTWMVPCAGAGAGAGAQEGSMTAVAWTMRHQTPFLHLCKSFLWSTSLSSLLFSHNVEKVLGNTIKHKV